MRAVVHWFRSVIILGGLSALPCGQAAPSLVPEGGSTSRPATRTEGMPAGFGAGKLQHIVPSAHSRAGPDGNSTLAIMLAALGVAALVAARAPASRTPSVETMPNEPARR